MANLSNINDFFVVEQTTGKVGIGTASPSAALEVKVANPRVKVTATTGTNPSYLNINNTGGQTYVGQESSVAGSEFTGTTAYASVFGSGSSRDTQFLTNTTVRMTIDTSGNVGIGVEDPDCKLEIKGATGSTALTFKTTDVSSNEVFYVQDGGRAGLNYYPFTIGVASGTSATANARFQVATTGGDFVVLTNGNVGIGESAPNDDLHVYGSTKLVSGVVENPLLEIYAGVGAQTNDVVHIHCATATTSSYNLLRCEGDSDDPTAFDAFTVRGDGTVTASGDVVAYSDKKLKKNIKTLDGSKVYEMRGVSFERIDTDKPSSGVIAQEIQKIAPELISESNDILGVAYGNLTGYLIEAIKDLKVEIEELKQKSCNCK